MSGRCQEVSGRCQEVSTRAPPLCYFMGVQRTVTDSLHLWSHCDDPGNCWLNSGLNAALIVIRNNVRQERFRRRFPCVFSV